MVVHGFCLLRNALIEHLEKESWIEVCATAQRLNEETKEMMKEHQPNVLVLNVSLKCCVGIPSVKKLKREFPEMKILALSCDAEFEEVFVGQALCAGADGYISSKDSLKDLLLAILSVPGKNISASQRQNHSANNEMLVGLAPQQVAVNAG